MAIKLPPKIAVKVADIAAIEATDPSNKPFCCSSDIDNKKANIAEYPTAYMTAIKTLNNWNVLGMVLTVKYTIALNVYNERQNNTSCLGENLA